jgi:hypothetical protein
MTKVAVNWEKADGIWEVILRPIKENQIIISRKKKVSTNTKYKFGLPGLGVRRFEYDEVKVDVVSSLNINSDVEKACLQEDEDCRPRQLLVKTFWGRLLSLPFWRIVPFYNASYASHKTLPWTKNTIIPMDPKLYSEMSKNDSMFELLRRDAGMGMLLGVIVGVALGAFGMYTFYPMVYSYINPPANVTKSVSNATMYVVKGVFGLWMVPAALSLLRRRKRK